MLKNMRKSLATILVAAALVGVPMALPTAAYAQAAGGGGAGGSSTGGSIDIAHDLGCGANLDTTQTNCDTSAGKEKLQNIVTLVINLFSIAIGIFAVIMILVAGGKYIKGGDASVKEARGQLMYAVVGLVVVALAQFVVKFVLEKVTSTGSST